MNETAQKMTDDLRLEAQVRQVVAGRFERFCQEDSKLFGEVSVEAVEAYASVDRSRKRAERAARILADWQEGQRLAAEEVNDIDCGLTGRPGCPRSRVALRSLAARIQRASQAESDDNPH